MHERKGKWYLLLSSWTCISSPNGVWSPSRRGLFWKSGEKGGVKALSLTMGELPRPFCRTQDPPLLLKSGSEDGGTGPSWALRLLGGGEEKEGVHCVFPAGCQGEGPEAEWLCPIPSCPLRLRHQRSFYGEGRL